MRRGERVSRVIFGVGVSNFHQKLFPFIRFLGGASRQAPLIVILQVRASRQQTFSVVRVRASRQQTLRRRGALARCRQPWCKNNRAAEVGNIFPHFVSIIPVGLRANDLQLAEI